MEIENRRVKTISSPKLENILCNLILSSSSNFQVILSHLGLLDKQIFEFTLIYDANTKLSKSIKQYKSQYYTVYENF